MPYLYAKYEGQAAAQEAQRVFGIEDARITVVEAWCSSFTDPGEDWCEVKAFDAGGLLLHQRRIRGY
jgi:hypothetical protein